MKILIIAAGRLKQSPEAALAAEFLKRIPWPIEMIEVEERRLEGKKRIESEGEKLLGKIPGGIFVIALERTGKAVSSEQFAALIQTRMEAGDRALAFVVGGAEGLSGAVLARANLKLSFGPATWPHQLARVMLAEQLYRAWAILSGHPYHK